MCRVMPRPRAKFCIQHACSEFHISFLKIEKNILFFPHDFLLERKGSMEKSVFNGLTSGLRFKKEKSAPFKEIFEVFSSLFPSLLPSSATFFLNNMSMSVLTNLLLCVFPFCVGWWC
jgi:hypothetical protein